MVTSKEAPIAGILFESINSLILTQNTDGGFPYNDKGTPSGAWTSCGVLWALANADTSIMERLNTNTIDYILSNQNNDGSISYTKKGDYGCIDATAQYILFMLLAEKPLLQARYRKSVTKAINLLIDIYKDAGWGTTTLSRYVISSTTNVLLSLNMLINHPQIDTLFALNPQKIKDIISACISRITLNQNADGGWGMYDGDDSKACTTAFAMLAIFFCMDDSIDMKKGILEKGSTYLLNSQNHDGSWDDVIERDAGFTVIRQSVPYCIFALCAIGRCITDIRIKKSFVYMMSKVRSGMYQYRDSTVTTWSTRDVLISLCAVQESIGRKNDIIKLLDYSIQTEKLLEETQTLLKTTIAEADEKQQRIVKEKLEYQRRHITVLNVQLSILLFLCLGLGLLQINNIVPISIELNIAIIGILIGLWGTLTTIIFKR